MKVSYGRSSCDGDSWFSGADTRPASFSGARHFFILSCSLIRLNFFIPDGERGHDIYAWAFFSPRLRLVTALPCMRGEYRRFPKTDTAITKGARSQVIDGCARLTVTVML